MKNVSVVIILDYLLIVVKEKDNINDFIIKNRQQNRQHHHYLSNTDAISRDINKAKTALIQLIRDIKEVIKNWRLETFVQSKETIKADINQESFIKTQESIKNKSHPQDTIQ